MTHVARMVSARKLLAVFEASELSKVEVGRRLAAATHGRKGTPKEEKNARRQFQKWLQDDSRITFANVDRLTKVFGVTPEDVYADEGRDERTEIAELLANAMLGQAVAATTEDPQLLRRDPGRLRRFAEALRELADVVEEAAESEADGSPTP